MKRNQIIAVLAAAGIIAGGAVTGTALASDDGADSGSRQLRSAGAADAEPGARSAADQGPAGPREAVERALAEVPGLAAGLELEEDDNLWEVLVLREDGTYREVEVDRENGRVLGQDRSDDDSDDDADDGDGPASVRAALAGAKVSLADAARIAAGQDRGTVEEIELEDGSWAVEYTDEGSSDDADDGVRIDLTSGAVSPDTDDDHDDRDDRDDKDDRDDERDDKDDRDDV
ncbi:hypothetical protein GCM10023347_43180 [Streptomyces chumphonensis]|uniref:PepSY domain-containing protein n=1 Tax=Streptomyces chumphonensis TaxID=1214925 RepID=A0A927IEH4_9ACTN|nr:PepSY domain-containing protein [Streptomyces chumphonensis]MBD3934157.1 PepSY domain-containing protein [Streptomyces chumphonensis]